MAIIKPLQSITLKNDNGEDTTYVVASAPAIVETTEPANMASFTDGAAGLPVKSLLADIDPVQNLNGQSAPYPAGGGKNLLNADNVTITGTTTTTSAQDVADITLTAGVTYVFSYDQDVTLTSNARNTPQLVYGGTATNQTASTNANLSSGRKTWVYTPSNTGVYKFRIWINTPDKTVKYTNFMCEVGSSATTYAPYSNICPITGWTGMNVYRTGKNLLNPDWQTEDVSTRKRWAWTNGFLLKGGKTYTFSAYGQDGITVYFAFVDGSASVSGTTTVSYTATADTMCKLQAIRSNGINNDVTFQLEVGSAKTDYEPFVLATYPISWADEAGTVYGGTLDVTNGVLTVTHVKSTLTNFYSSRIKPYSTGGKNGIYFETLLDISGTRREGWCNMASVITTSTSTLPHFMWFGVNSKNLFWVGILDALGLADVDAFVTWLRQNDLYIVQELATPQTYQLTPQAVTTLLGENNIWADTGDVETAYCADTKMYIDKVIAAL